MKDTKNLVLFMGEYYNVSKPQPTSTPRSPPAGIHGEVSKMAKTMKDTSLSPHQRWHLDLISRINPCFNFFSSDTQRAVGILPRTPTMNDH